jgi:hypothetical protein
MLEVIDQSNAFFEVDKVTSGKFEILDKEISKQKPYLIQI